MIEASKLLAWLEDSTHAATKLGVEKYEGMLFAMTNPKEMEELDVSVTSVADTSSLVHIKPNELAVAKRTQSFIPSEAYQAAKAEKDQASSREIGFAAGSIFTWVGAFLASAISVGNGVTGDMALALTTGGIASIAGITGSIFIAQSVKHGRKWKTLKESFAQLVAKEGQNVKGLLYHNFGREVISAADLGVRDFQGMAFRGRSWRKGDEVFTVKYDEETSSYSFERNDYFDDVKDMDLLGSSFNEELRNQVMTLKASELDDESMTVLRHMLSNISVMIKSPLSIEKEHVIKRALVDAAALIQLQEGVKALNQNAVPPQLRKGLTALDAEVDNLISNEKAQMNRQLESYTNYIESREKEALSQTTE